MPLNANLQWLKSKFACNSQKSNSSQQLNHRERKDASGIVGRNQFGLMAKIA